MTEESKNKIKKILYKDNPTANIAWITKSGMQYNALVETEEEPLLVIFIVPLDEIGDAKFSPKMDSKLLIRYIVAFNKIPKED